MSTEPLTPAAVLRRRDFLRLTSAGVSAAAVSGLINTPSNAARATSFVLVVSS